MDENVKIDHCEKLKTDVVKLLENQELCDIVFTVDDDRKFPANKALLASRCEYFRAMFYGQMLEAGQKETHLPDTPAESFKAFLAYIYSGEANLSEMDYATVLDLYRLANRYLITDLRDSIAKRLKYVSTLNDIFVILKSPEMWNLDGLLEASFQFVDGNAVEFLESDDFTLLTTDILDDILQRDTFMAEEEPIFDAVKKWIEANAGKDREEHQRILQNVRLSQIPLRKISDFNKKTGLFTEKEIKRAYPRCFAEPTENIATIDNGTEVINGTPTKGALENCIIANNKTETFSSRSYYKHQVGVPGQSITFRLGRPYTLKCIKFYILNRKRGYSSYYVETSLYGDEWKRVVDLTSVDCTSWQTLEFDAHPLQFIRIVGTKVFNNCDDQFFRVVYFECPVQEKETLSRKRRRV